MKKLIVFLLVCTVGLAQTVSVRRNLTTNGAVLGGLAGAIIGNNSGHGNGAQGALIGAAAGAILGSAAADAQGAPPYRGGDPVVGGAVFGGITGAIIGNNSGHGNGGKGALIGAAAGAILGSTPHHQPVARPYYGYGYGRSHYGRPYIGSYGAYGTYPTYQSYPTYGRSYDSGDSTTAGMLLGGIAGAIIGNNSGHGNGARGALIGAGIGALIGAASEPAPRSYDESPRYYAAPRTSYVQQMQTMQPSPQQVTIINNYYGNVSPASGGYKMDAPAY